MPRGGQGGRGGFGRGRISRVDQPWDDDPDLKIENKPSELFPRVQPPVAELPTRVERAQVARYRTLRDRIHEGPLYTILSDEARAGKPESQAANVINPFEGMDTYTQKYRKKRARLPRLDTRPYELRFFPKELWSTLDPSHSKAEKSTRKRKRLDIALGNKMSRIERLEEEAEQKVAEEENEERKEELDDDEEPQEDEERDTDFENDEDENDDYNAEQYFDDGEDDYDDRGADGGDGDYDF